MTGGNITERNSAAGSALILVVLLTSILAIVGVLFMMSSRIDEMSSASIRQEKDLDAAIASIVTKLADELVLDTPGIGGQSDYYDYPGDKDTWLASMEPYNDAGTYRWGQISDLTGYIRARNWDPCDIEPRIVPERETIKLDKDGIIEDEDSSNDGQRADADGDGVADSKWIELEDISSSTGQPVYAAIRVIDNGGMLNINTAYVFDANSNDPCLIDGSRLAQIHLMDVVKGVTDDPMKIHEYRCDGDTPDLVDFNYECAIRPLNPDRRNVNYLPYDISDELELRNRFIIDSDGTVCRIENAIPITLTYDQGQTYGNKMVPYDANFPRWEEIMTRESGYDYNLRHILTAFNADRIIAPPNDVNSTGPATMININMDPNELDLSSYGAAETDSLEKAKELYAAFVMSIDPNLNLNLTTRKRIKREYAQLAVNLVDLRDRDLDVTSLNLAIDDTGPFTNDFVGDEYIYGFEPFPVITQVAIRIDVNDPCENLNYYAVELFNPFSHNNNPLNLSAGEFELVITDVNEFFDPNDPNTFGSKIREVIQLDSVMDEDDFHVVYNADPGFTFGGLGTSFQQEPNLILSGDYRVPRDPMGGEPNPDPCIVNAYNVAVRRYVNVRQISPADPNLIVEGNRYVYLDRQLIYRDWVRWSANLSEPNQHTRFYGRRFGLDLPDVTWWDVVYPLTLPQASSDPCFVSLTIGASDYSNRPTDPNLRPTIDIAVPYGPDKDLVTVGDIARIWTIGPTDVLYDPCDVDLLGESMIFDVNVLDVDPCDQDPNGRLLNFNQYRRTMGETLMFVSISKGIGNSEDEDLIRLNLGDPYNSNVFNYITVFDPRVDRVDNDGDGNGEDEVDESEKKINGRININTAPRFVLEQLPWMTPEIAEAIVAYRDKLRNPVDYYGTRGRYTRINNELDRFFDYDDIREDKGFASIGELNLVINSGQDNYNIRHYALPGNPLPAVFPFYPDLTDAYRFDDKADNDFEERDLIFARISNLVTVRSDVFSAYILVRLGVDGPQKRVIAILDRSDVYKGADKVKIIALHPVPDPR